MDTGIGQPVRRKEDFRLVRGAGRYSDDVNLPGQAYAVFVRSPVAHGDIKSVGIDAAKAAPGVLAVYTHADIDAAGFGHLPNNLPLKSRDGSDLIKPPRPILATGRVRNVGEPVVAVPRSVGSDAASRGMLVRRNFSRHWRRRTWPTPVCSRPSRWPACPSTTTRLVPPNSSSNGPRSRRGLDEHVPKPTPSSGR